MSQVPRIEELVFPWERRWVRREGPGFPSYDGGFLADLSRHPLFDTQHVLTDDQVVELPCAILLGEPGSGKSTALKALAAGEAKKRPDILTLSVDLGLCGSDDSLRRRIFESATMRGWLQGSGQALLYLDGLDECQQDLHQVSALLLEGLGSLPVDRLLLRIACRTVAWPRLLRQGLDQLWGSRAVEELELAPLTEADARVAARLLGLSDEQFIQSVHASRVEPFAARPLTLRLLLDVFSADGGLPRELASLYERGCGRLVEESSLSRQASGRTGRLTSQERLALAGRIAAVSVVALRRTIYPGSDESRAGDGEARLSDLAWNEGSDTADRGRKDGILEVLDSQLFSGRPDGRVGWSHWTFAEFLAARYCCAHLGVLQVRPLLVGEDTAGRARITPQYRGLASWLAALDAQWAETLAELAPELLLRVPDALSSESARVIAARRLLDLLAQGALSDWDLGRRDYCTLDHPGLAAQLAPWVQDRSQNVIVRRAAIQIAEACECADVVPLLVDLALDQAETCHLRTIAVHALVAIGTPTVKERLRPLLDTPAEQDPREELKAAVLSALWPGHLSMSQVLAELTPPRMRGAEGLNPFLSSLFEAGIHGDDLVRALMWVASNEGRSTPWGVRTASRQVLLQGLAALEDERVRAAVAGVLAQRVRRHESLLPGHDSDGDSKLPTLRDESRLDLIRLVALVVGRRRIWTLAHEYQWRGLLREADFDWLLEQAVRAPSEEEATTLGELAATVCKGRRERAAFRSAALASDHLRLVYQEFTARRKSPRPRKRPKTPRSTRPPLAERMRQHLDLWEGGHLHAWARMNLDMGIPDGQEQAWGVEHKYDATALPGWQSMSEGDRERFLGAGLAYLRLATNQAGGWVFEAGGVGRYRDPEWTGWGAWRALRLLDQERPQLLDGLTPDTWAEWATVIASPPELLDDGAGKAMRRLVARAYALAPDAILDALSKRLDLDGERGMLPNALYAFLPSWDGRMADHLLAYLTAHQGTLRADGLGVLLDELLVHEDERAFELAVALVNPPLDPGGLPRPAAVAAAGSLLRVWPRRGWAVVWPCFQTAPTFGRHVTSSIVSMRSEPNRFAKDADEEALADYYEWLCGQYPPEDDPPDTGGAVTGRWVAARFRDELPYLLKARATDGAVNALRRLASVFPQQLSLKLILSEAEDARLETAWRGLSPTDLRALVADRRARIVQTLGQLLTLVLESLDRLQERLRHEPGLLESLWNETKPKDEAQLSDVVAAHLEHDFEKSVVINREPEVMRGAETDIKIDAPVPTPGPGGLTTAIVEVKGSWNPTLGKAMQAQLRDRYIREARNVCGVYLVGWFKTADPGGCVDRLTEQARTLSTPRNPIRAFVIDARRATRSAQPEARARRRPRRASKRQG